MERKWENASEEVEAAVGWPRLRGTQEDPVVSSAMEVASSCPGPCSDLSGLCYFFIPLLQREN